VSAGAYSPGAVGKKTVTFLGNSFTRDTAVNLRKTPSQMPQTAAINGRRRMNCEPIPENLAEE
jgi:hypothetical protein